MSHQVVNCAVYPAINYEAYRPEFEGYASNVYSQFGEDGLIERLFEIGGTKNRECFEFGAADGIFCSNTRHLCENGWHGAWIEENETLYTMLRCHKPDSVFSIRGKVTPETVDVMLAACGVEPGIDFGVIDVDGTDFDIWKAMAVEPRGLLIEYRSGKSLSLDVLDNMIVYGESRGYEPVARTFCNLLLGKKEMFDGE